MSLSGGESVNCSLESVEGVVRCLTTAKPWIELALAVLGLGTVALFSALLWTIKSWRADKSRLTIQMATLSEATAASQRIARVAERERDFATQERDLARSERSGDQSTQQMQMRKAEVFIHDLGARVASARSVCSGDSAAFWSRPVGRMPKFDCQMRDSIPVTMFANQKGGVGKTTLATNIAACWAEQGEKVLIFDLDYQGSTTGLMLAQAGNRSTEFKSKIDILFDNPLNEYWPSIAIDRIPSLSNLSFVPTNYSFERIERCSEYSWVIGDAVEDVRFLLRRIVSSNFVQTNYTRVVIDAPPRITLGFVNGLACSTHLFVPTVVDMTSAAAVGLFAKQFDQLREVVNPQVAFAGIIGTMTNVAHLTASAMTAADAAERATRSALRTNDDYFLRNAIMRRDAKVSHSTEAGIAYLQEPSTRPMFIKIADEIAKRAPLKRN